MFKNWRLGVITISLLIAFSSLSPVSAAPSNGLRYTISVAQFENRSNWSGQYQLGDAYGAVLTDVLNQSGRYIVLAEKDMRNEAAAESGQPGTAAQLLVKGVITHVQNTSNSGGGISLGGVLLGGTQSESEINVTMYIVDSASGRVLASKSIVGKSSGGGVLIGGGGAVFGTHHNDNMGKAVETPSPKRSPGWICSCRRSNGPVWSSLMKTALFISTVVRVKASASVNGCWSDRLKCCAIRNRTKCLTKR